MSQIKRKSFVLYMDFEESFQYLSMEERGLLLTAIYAYVGGAPVSEDLPITVNVAFSFIRKILDRDGAAYEERCRTAVENGKKGGRPKKAPVTEKKTDLVFQKPDNDNDNDIDIDIDIDNDIDIVNDSDSGNDRDRFADSPLCSAPTPGSAAPLTEYEKQDLLALGIPLDYISLRQSRALSYAQARGKTVMDVLLSWWQEDQRKKKSHPKQAPPKSENKSYDTDDFFQAALARSNRNLAGAG